MRIPRWVWWTLLTVALVLLVWGWFILSFLTEPSAIGRLRTALIVMGAGSIVVGIVGAVVGVSMLISAFVRRRSTRN
jgi:hypothetical protein